MVDKLNQMPGTSTFEELPLTTAMRDALARKRAKKLGQQRMYGALGVAIVVAGVVLFATVGRTSPDAAVVVGGFILIVGGIIAAAAWQEAVVAPRRLAAAIQGGQYTRYVGWFVTSSNKGNSNRTSRSLFLVHTTLSIPYADESSSFWKQPNSDDPWWAAIDYVPGTDMVLAIWHGEFKLLHRHPLYDPESDPAWARPVLDAPPKPAWAKQRR